jgi:hypothetical protein
MTLAANLSIPNHDECTGEKCRNSEVSLYVIIVLSKTLLISVHVFKYHDPTGTLRKNVSLVQKLRRTSIERSFFAECPCETVVTIVSASNVILSSRPSPEWQSFLVPGWTREWAHKYVKPRGHSDTLFNLMSWEREYSPKLVFFNENAALRHYSVDFWMLSPAMSCHVTVYFRNSTQTWCVRTALSKTSVKGSYWVRKSCAKYCP